MNSQMTIAAHIMGILAYHDAKSDGPVTSEVLAESVGTNPVVIRRVLAQLKQAGLVDSRRGVGGGSVLGMAPDQISLRDIYTAVTEEEKPIIGRHASPCGEDCNIAPVIIDYLGELYADAERALLERLGAVTVADMLQTLDQRLTTCKYQQDT